MTKSRKKEGNRQEIQKKDKEKQRDGTVKPSHGKWHSWLPLIRAAAVAGGLTLLASLGVLETADMAASDAWYQQPQALDGNLVLIGIDNRALEEIGPYQQWGRGVMADVLEALNQSEECRPAVIGIDVLYAGDSSPEADSLLAEAAGRYGNVVTACMAQYKDTFLEDAEGNFYRNRFAIVGFEEPYNALLSVTQQGHINAMLDTDGILRHHLLAIRLPDGSQVPSMALAVAQKYQESRGETLAALPPTDANGFWYLPFCGKPGAFYESISVTDLLSGRISATHFAGKIVLIGPYAAALQDSYLTSMDHARHMYGVEFQANAIQALLWGDYKAEVKDWIQLSFLFAVLLAGVLVFRNRRLRTSTALWLLLCGGYLALCKALYNFGLVLHVLWIPVGITILYAVCLALNYVRAAAERRHVTNTFKRYVAPEIVNDILAKGTDALKLEGSTVDIAVLFVDVRGFTTMSEKLKAHPEKVVNVLNRYLELFASCIMRHQGTLDKFVGDQAMAFWGAPLEQADYVMKAVRAAWDMIEGAEKMLEEYDAGQEGDSLEPHSLSFGIGVHVGKAVVGNVGSQQRMDYTAIGDTVNTAARLEANAPSGTIYISQAVADMLQGRIETSPPDKPVHLKGKEEGFVVLKLTRILDPEPLRQSSPGPENPRNQ